MPGCIGVPLIDHVGKGADRLLVIGIALLFKPRQHRLLLKGMHRKADVPGQLLEHGDFLRFESFRTHGIDAEYPQGGRVSLRPERQGNDGAEFGRVVQVKPGGDRGLVFSLDPCDRGVGGESASSGREGKGIVPLV